MRLLFVLVCLLLAGCGEGPAPQKDIWLGRWTGPEGTFLEIAKDGDRYAITIQDLDGPKAYQGTAVGEQIQFQRAGTTESLRATDGPGTGMKWLQDKKDCLVIRPGEGFCR